MMTNDLYYLESSFGGWPISELKKVLDAIENYRLKKLSDCESLRVCSLEKNLKSKDKNDRVDIEVNYIHNGQFIYQKLLMMKGEVVDGSEFHKRFQEFYPEKIS